MIIKNLEIWIKSLFLKNLKILKIYFVCKKKNAFPLVLTIEEICLWPELSSPTRFKVHEGVVWVLWRMKSKQKTLCLIYRIPTLIAMLMYHLSSGWTAALKFNGWSPGPMVWTTAAAAFQFNGSIEVLCPLTNERPKKQISELLIAPWRRA